MARPRYWWFEDVVGAYVDDWLQDGRPPTSYSWERRGRERPPRSSVILTFGSWGNLHLAGARELLRESVFASGPGGDFDIETDEWHRRADFAFAVGAMALHRLFGEWIHQTRHADPAEESGLRLSVFARWLLVEGWCRGYDSALGWWPYPLTQEEYGQRSQWAQPFALRLARPTVPPQQTRLELCGPGLSCFIDPSEREQQIQGALDFGARPAELEVAWAAASRSSVHGPAIASALALDGVITYGGATHRRTSLVRDHRPKPPGGDSLRNR